MADFDVAMISDLRFPGGTSTAIASEIKALSSAGYRICLVPYATSFLSKKRMFHPVISRAIQDGLAELVAPGTTVFARLACLHHPAAFQTLPAEPLGVSFDKAVLVVHHPPVDADGVSQYDVSGIEEVIRSAFNARVPWAPVGPQVRQAFARVAKPPLLTAENWVNTIDANEYRGVRPGPIGGQLIVGRHSRPDPLKWPDDASTMRDAYPVAPDIPVRLMGFQPGVIKGLDQLPENWSVTPFGSQSARAFLNSIDIFSYFHSRSWTEAFGRSILEAMASGLVCLLPRSFEPLFGDATIYCQENEVASIARRLAREPDTYGRFSARAVNLVQDKFGPDRAVSRVEALIGPPHSKPVSIATNTGNSKPRIVYFTSNGVGMGHLTRVLACARRHRDLAEPILISMSRAYGVARRDGIMTEYLPFFRSSGMDEQLWHRSLTTELTEMLRFYRPSVFVLDGNVPYWGLTDALLEFPSLWKIWLRRAMWPPDVGAHFLAQEHAFDAVIEPGEYAAILDRGLTVQRRKDAVQVAPITYLAEDEALERSAAQTVLGLDPNLPAVFLQLGAGNNIEINRLQSMIIEKLKRDTDGPAPQIVIGQWQIGENGTSAPDGTTVLRNFPFARFLNAFDYSVAMAGYNTFHENLLAGLPTLFLANEHPEQDEQWLRASYASQRGVALAARLGDTYSILRQLHELSNAKRREVIRASCRRLSRDNGADAAAAYLADLAYLRRPHFAHDSDVAS